MAMKYLLGGLALLGMASAAHATVYTQDSNVADFTSGIDYATLSNFTGGDVASPFTPTASEIANQGFRVFGGGSVTGLPTTNNWILATFGSAQSVIRVFPNIDHLGAAFDGFQYTIEGSNDGTHWTFLFDALTVVGSGEPFTLGTFNGTAPTKVNNVVTPGAGPAGTVGYEADFSFSQSFTDFAFGASTIAVADGNADQELSAVGAIPEPSAWLLLLTGLGIFAFYRRRGSVS